MTVPAHARQTLLTAALGVLLSGIVAWKTGIPIAVGSLELAPFAVGLVVASALGVFLNATDAGRRLAMALAETRAGELLVLALGILVLVFFSGVHTFPYPGALASGILGASLGSLIRLALA